LRGYFGAKNLQTQAVTRANLHKTRLYKEGAHKMLMKLTPVVNFNKKFRTLTPKKFKTKL